jgi:hypothetical protein
VLWTLQAGCIAIANAHRQRPDYCGVNAAQPVVIGSQEGMKENGKIFDVGSVLTPFRA